MIGHRVRLVFAPGSSAMTGVLHKLDAFGATIYDENKPRDSLVFIPMHRIHEIIDLGRAP